tara:strand:+ start:339 stop:527 length:189 start_codon:yes stop_codon:yes gene_type:complete
LIPFRSYSGAKPGYANLRPELKKPVGDRIFFAGEATAGAYSIVHGADRSGRGLLQTSLYHQL